MGLSVFEEDDDDGDEGMQGSGRIDASVLLVYAMSVDEVRVGSFSSTTTRWGLFAVVLFGYLDPDVWISSEVGSIEVIDG